MITRGVTKKAIDNLEMYDNGQENISLTLQFRIISLFHRSLSSAH